MRRDIEEDGGAGRKKYVNLKGGVAKATQKALKCNGFLTSLLTTLHLWTPEVTISSYFTCKNESSHSKDTTRKAPINCL